MNYYIGEAAGKVWEYLNNQKTKEATFSKLEKDLDLDDNFIKMEAGLLMKEKQTCQAKVLVQK